MIFKVPSDNSVPRLLILNNYYNNLMLCDLQIDEIVDF